MPMALPPWLPAIMGTLFLKGYADSIGDDPDLFTLVLTLQSTTNVSVGQTAFNQMFWDLRMFEVYGSFKY